jgi:hypothetical protein
MARGWVSGETARREKQKGAAALRLSGTMRIEQVHDAFRSAAQLHAGAAALG